MTTSTHESTQPSFQFVAVPPERLLPSTIEECGKHNNFTIGKFPMSWTLLTVPRGVTASLAEYGSVLSYNLDGGYICDCDGKPIGLDNSDTQPLVTGSTDTTNTSKKQCAIL